MQMHGGIILDLCVAFVLWVNGALCLMESKGT